MTPKAICTSLAALGCIAAFVIAIGNLDGWRTLETFVLFCLLMNSVNWVRELE